MNHSKNLMEKASARMGLPKEFLANQPVFEIVGFSQLSIEPHHGVTEYSPERVSVRVSTGIVCISGTDLAISRMNNQHLTISGQIGEITFLSEFDHG